MHIYLLIKQFNKKFLDEILQMKKDTKEIIKTNDINKTKDKY